MFRIDGLGFGANVFLPSESFSVAIASSFIIHLYTRQKHVTRHTSHFTLHTSHFTLHTSHFTLHTSHFTLHTSHFTTIRMRHSPTHRLVHLNALHILRSGSGSIKHPATRAHVTHKHTRMCRCSNIRPLTSLPAPCSPSARPAAWVQWSGGRSRRAPGSRPG